ncbi:membrane protein [Longimycelium tulufanense]|uniref:Membrane protein n=1 Tax=Longimycelium tulufanense TaxID=907463 RepID=A0A8J3CC65_9PSEU|nr:DUF2165 domain-containing protein [Longimycelium tulufanense]GGM46050.1 membrane protein [Longimycelium tulufanense]
MRVLAWFGSLRAVLSVLTATSALYMALVVLGNITDFGTNRAFVEHVFAMDTTFQSPNTMWRAVTDQTVVTVVYLAIITWEAITAVVLTAAFVSWMRAFAMGRGAELARRLSSAGWLMQATLFGGGFVTIGGEWFQMWQSEKWNGLQPAFQNFLIAAVGLILVHLGRPGTPEQNRQQAVE